MIPQESKLATRTVLFLLIVAAAQGCTENFPQRHIDAVFGSFPSIGSPTIVQIFRFEHDSNQTDVYSSGRFQIEEKDHAGILARCLETEANNGLLREQQSSENLVCKMRISNARGTVSIVVDRVRPIIEYRFKG
ncbi:hypothetical protein [Thiosocius teredinicola]|uniref:hypothetical protein n=1 Tax=Thiosocius teredinicola TaxID=1973002 RepID=UPI00099118B2